MRRLMTAAWPIAPIVACGPSARFVEDGAAEASSETGRATAGSGGVVDGESDGGPPPLTCIAAPTRGEDPLLGVSACDDYYGMLGERPLDEVTVRIVNKRPDTLRVPSVPEGPAVRHFTMSGSMGGRPVRTVSERCHAEWSPPSCVSYSPDGGILCNPIAFDRAPDLVVEPGEYVEEVWEAWLVASTDIPPQCHATGESVPCTVPVRPGPGTYTVTVRGDMGDYFIQTYAEWDGLCPVIEVVFGG